jgi:hypothetical protein
MNFFLVLMLRMALAFAFLFSVFGQVAIVPNSLADELRVTYGPEMIPVLIPAAIIGIAFVQIVFAASWMLLGMIASDSIFSDRAFRWVDVIIGATAAATLLAAGMFCYVFVAGSNSTADEMPLLGALGSLIACGGAGAAFGMLMLIMRGLLRKATEMKTEMAEVI